MFSYWWHWRHGVLSPQGSTKLLTAEQTLQMLSLHSWWFSMCPWCNVHHCCRNISNHCTTELPTAEWKKKPQNSSLLCSFHSASHSQFCSLNLICHFSMAPPHPCFMIVCGVFFFFFQWLSISSLWAWPWTLMMAVSRTTAAVDTSWSRRCSCPVRRALIPLVAIPASNPHTCC